MPRKAVIYCNTNPYHVTARSNNRDWFDVPLNDCYGVYTEVLSECISRFHVKLHAFVLMSNHFHMIITTPHGNIGEVLRYFMTETSRGIRYKSKRINHIYGGRNHKTLITDPAYYAHCFKYVLRNPVRANITEKVEDYRWSTISSQLSRMKELTTPANQDCTLYLPENHALLLKWLNESTPKTFDEVCRKALKRSEFKLKSCRVSQKIPTSTALLPQKVPGT